MPSPASSPSPELQDEASTKQRDPGDVSAASKTAGNSESDCGLQDGTSAKSRDSSDASAASSEMADNNWSDSDISQPQILNQLKNSSDDSEPTLSICPSPSNLPQPQNLGQLKNSSDENKPALSSHPSNNPGDQHSNTGETNSDSRLDGNTRRFRLYDKVCTLALARYRLSRVRQTFLQ